MKVLVIVPVHDRVEFMAEALASLDAQTRRADEIVVTGNLPYDVVAPLIPQKLPTAVVVNEAVLVDRLNRAIAASDCDAFVVLCDDDRLAPTFLERTVYEMERTRADISYTDLQCFGDRHDQCPARPWTLGAVSSNCTPYVTALCRKSAWERAGGYQPGAFFDWVFWYRCFHTGATAVHLEREYLFCWRSHPAQGTNTVDQEAGRRETLQTFARTLPELQRANAVSGQPRPLGVQYGVNAIAFQTQRGVR